jgi:hypothetical protein
MSVETKRSTPPPTSSLQHPWLQKLKPLLLVDDSNVASRIGASTEDNVVMKKQNWTTATSATASVSHRAAFP